MKERSAPELMVSEVTGQRRRKEEEDSLVQCSCCGRLQPHTRISHFFPHGVTTRSARAHKIAVKSFSRRRSKPKRRRDRFCAFVGSVSLQRNIRVGKGMGRTHKKKCAIPPNHADDSEVKQEREIIQQFRKKLENLVRCIFANFFNFERNSTT